MLKILHTSDWHLGQNFFNFDRTQEHIAFLAWLTTQIHIQNPHALLVAGDIFHHASPPFQAVAQFYDFLGQLSRQFPKLNIIMIAGNHDSGQKVELPQVLAQNHRLHLIGQLHFDPQTNTIAFDKHCIPLRGTDDDDILGWCLAVPYLNSLHLQHFNASRIAYEKKLALLYHQLFDFVTTKNITRRPCLALGHLFLQSTELSTESERILFDDALPDSIFPETLDYIALGHLHRPQQVGTTRAIYYSGSPIPLSFAEKNYSHQIKSVTFCENQLPEVITIPIPRQVSFLSLPPTPQHFEAVCDFLSAYPFEPQKDITNFPFLEINLLRDPEKPFSGLSLNEAFLQILEKKPVRFVKVKYFHLDKTQNRIVQMIEQNTTYAQAAATPDQHSISFLEKLDPIQVFEQLYARTYPQEIIPTHLKRLFTEIVEKCRE